MTPEQVKEQEIRNRQELLTQMVKNEVFQDLIVGFLENVKETELLVLASSETKTRYLLRSSGRLSLAMELWGRIFSEQGRLEEAKKELMDGNQLDNMDNE